MRFASFVDLPRQVPRVISLLQVVCIVGTLTIAAAAQADSDAPDDARVVKDPAKETLPAEKDPKKLAKYDVEHIGRRGIGHGFNIYNRTRERQLGASLAAAFDHNTKVITDPVINEYINQLAQRIVRNSDAEIPFIIKVIDAGDIPRAYGLPGGFLYVDSALLLAAESEAELASLMAHEIAHVAARHATRALTRKNLYSFGGSLSLLAGPIGIVLQDAGGVAGPLTVKKFSRESEYEADLLAIEYAYAAGYDPEALLSALEKLHAMEATRGNVFDKVPGAHFASHVPFHDRIARGFSNYPLMEERIHRLQSEITAFLPDRKDYILDTNEFQDVKAHLISLRGPLQIRQHSENENPKAPVLRRAPEEDTETPSGRLRSSLTLLP